MGRKWVLSPLWEHLFLNIITHIISCHNKHHVSMNVSNQLTKLNQNQLGKYITQCKYLPGSGKKSTQHFVSIFHNVQRKYANCARDGIHVHLVKPVIYFHLDDDVDKLAKQRRTRNKVINMHFINTISLFCWCCCKVR